MTLRRRWAADDGTYLSVLLLSIVVAKAVEFLWPPAQVFGVPLSTATAIAGAVLTALAWAAFRPRLAWDRWTAAFLAAALLAWALTAGLTLKHEDFLDAAVVVPPLAICLIWIKRPSGPAVTRALDVLGWATVALCLGVLLAQQVGVLDLAVAGTATPLDDRRYWLPLSGVLGIDGRWIGPFRTPNVTASAAVFLVVYGVVRGRVTRVAFIATGALVLLLTGTRSSAFAAIAGLVVVALLQPRRRLFGVPKWILASVGALVLVASVAFWVARNPSLSGRLPIWPVYVDLWRTSPMTGVGDSGVGLTVEAGRLPGWASHAHSIVIDVLARDGVFAFGAVLAVLGLAIALAWRGARHGRPVGAALVASLLVGGVTETLFDWRYLGFQVTILVGAALVSAAYEVPGHGHAAAPSNAGTSASEPDAVDQVDAGPVGQMDVTGGGQGDQVGAGPDGQAPDVPSS